MFATFTWLLRKSHFVLEKNILTSLLYLRLHRRHGSWGQARGLEMAAHSCPMNLRHHLPRSSQCGVGYRTFFRQAEQDDPGTCSGLEGHFLHSCWPSQVTLNSSKLSHQPIPIREREIRNSRDIRPIESPDGFVHCQRRADVGMPHAPS